MKKLCLLGSIGILSAFCIQPAFPWGGSVHQFVNRKSVYHLPPAMSAFIQDSTTFASHASDADNRKDPSDTSLYAESPRHYIDLDDYPDFLNLPHSMDSVIALYGWERVKDNGTLPWATLWFYDSLVVQLRRGDWGTAVQTASDLGHYVADAHQPLHATKNYNGQLTGNYGIHSRYESTMLSSQYYLSALYVIPDSVHYISDRTGYVFDYINHSTSLADSIMHGDNAAKAASGWNGSGSPPPSYYTALWQYTGAMTIEQVQRATKSLANLWYSAWVDAGLFANLPAPLLVAPPDAAVNQLTSPTLQWNAVTGATSYRLAVSVDSLFGTSVFDDSTISGTSRLVGPLDANTGYFWRVRAKSTGTTGPYSSVWRFRTTDVPSAVILLQPPDGSSDVPLSQALLWHRSTNAERYRLQVALDSTFTAVVFQDSMLTDTSRIVHSLQAYTTYYWRAQAEGGGGWSSWSASWRLTTASTTAQQYLFAPQWNLISVPLTLEDSTTAGVFPPAISPAYAFDPRAGYVRRDTLRTGSGYWVKFPSEQTVPMTGVLRTRDSVLVVSGWNLIGSLSVSIPVSAIRQVPAGIISSSFYGYEGSYAVADTLQPARGYWVKASAAGAIILMPQITRHMQTLDVNVK